MVGNECWKMALDNLLAITKKGSSNIERGQLNPNGFVSEECPLDTCQSTMQSASNATRHLVLCLDTLILVTKAVGGHLFVVSFQCCEIFTCFGEFTLLHALTDVPVDEGTLAVHEVELVGESGPGLANGGGVGQHADGAVDGGEVTVGDVLGWLVADTDLETSRAPVNKLNGALGLDLGNGGMRVLGDNVTTVQEAGSHVLSVARVALDHLVVWLEASVGDLVDRVGLVGSLGGGDDGSIGDEREVDTGVGDQVGLELVQVDVQGAVESERGSNGGNDWNEVSGEQTGQRRIEWSNVPWAIRRFRFS
jgi:hypothetical protein